MKLPLRSTGCVLLVVACCMSQGQTVQPGKTPMATFHLAELFGVSWPDQPVEFRYDGGPPSADVRLFGPGGVEVPYQWTSSCSDATAKKGCIVVRTNLPARADYTWLLKSASAQNPKVMPANPVRIVQTGQNWVITNGVTGIRIPTQLGNPAPWNRSPIQGILLPGEQWTGVGASPNLLYAEKEDGCIGCVLHTPVRTATGYTVDIIDRGPLKVSLRAAYSFRRPRYAYGSNVINSAGLGHYVITITLYANSKSILIDEDSDMQFSYFIPLYNQVHPDQARYRGHDSIGASGHEETDCGYETPLSVTSVVSGNPLVIRTSLPTLPLSNGQALSISGARGVSEANGSFFAKTSGYSPGAFGVFSDRALTLPVKTDNTHLNDGIVKPAYRGQDLVPNADAYLDLTYSEDRPASYICSGGSYRKLLINYPPAAHAAGWYEELYKSDAGEDTPMVGIFTGQASKQLNSGTGPSMPGIYTSPRHWITGERDSGIQVDNLLRGPANDTAQVIHRNWGIFVSKKSDLLSPTSHQPIADDQNSQTGVNLSRLYTYQLKYPDPPGGWQWAYLSPQGANRLIRLVRDGSSVCGSVDCYYRLLRSSESSRWGTVLLDMWHGNDAGAVQAALNTAIQLAQRVETNLVSGDNRFDGPLHYYQLGLSTSPETAVLNAILMDSNATDDQKTIAKAALALFGSLFWDEDWFAIQQPTGEGMGLANQVQQYLQYRTQAVAAAPSQPFLASKLATALTYPANDFATYFSPTGAAAASTHYQSAFFEPLILNYMAFSKSGSLSMSDPKWTAYANWELSIQTPPEPRFGNLRKAYSNGNGNTEADVRTGMLATALYDHSPALAEKLMWAWRQSNSSGQLTEDSQFVTTLAAIDPSIPDLRPQLASINIPGYHSVERFNFGTPNETALWFINGGFYQTGGHRHHDDGQVSIYAHSAPLAIDWNANLYYPDTPGRFMHDSVVFDSELKHAWSADNAGLDDAAVLLRNPDNTEFAAFQNSTTSTARFEEADGTIWSRTVRMMNFDPSYPIIYVKDLFSGPGATNGKTLTWNLMATGPVLRSGGPPISPVVRMSLGCQLPAGALPSNGEVLPLSQGLNRLNFQGFTWPRHATKGINWDLFLLSDSSAQQFMIGNWGHGCQATREAAEYEAANGTKFAESQDILRVHGQGSFETIILPYRKTETPLRSVTIQPCGIEIVQEAASDKDISCFDQSAATYSAGTRRILAAYDNSSHTAFGATVSGGPQEVVIQGDHAYWTLAGARSGMRTLTLPEDWSPGTPVLRSGNSYSYAYAGGLQAAPVTITFSRIAQKQ